MQKLPVVFSVATMAGERRPSPLDQLAPAAAPWWIRQRPSSSLSPLVSLTRSRLISLRFSPITETLARSQPRIAAILVRPVSI